MRSTLICGSLWVMMAVFSAFPLMALDLPLHLAMGEIILDQGRVPPTNVVLHTQTDRPVVNDKWLHQVALCGVHRTAGPTGLVLFRMVLALAITLAAYGLSRRFAPPGPAGLATLGVALLLVHRLGVRPELWTYLFTPIFLLLLIDRKKHPVAIWILLLLLQAFWANLHVYFPLGIGLALVAGFPELVRKRGLTRFKGLLLVPGLLVVCLLNPSGLTGLLQPLEVAGSLGRLSAGAIGEMGPVWAAGLPVSLPRVAFFVFCLLALAGLVRARFRVELRVWPAALCLLILGAVLHRNLPLAGMGLLLLLAAAPPPGSIRGWFLVPAASLAVVALVLLGPLRDPAGDGRTPGTGWARDRFPMKTTEFLVKDRPLGEIFNDISSGSYYVSRAYPWKRAFIDGNTSGYPEAFLEEYRKVLALEIPHRSLTRSYGVTHFLLRHDARATRLLVPALFRDEGLILAYFDAVATVFMAREVAPGLQDRRPAWLREVLPHVRDTLFPDRRRARPLLDQTVQLIAEGHTDAALDLVKHAVVLDPWEARSFRLSAMVYRAQKNTELEVLAWRTAALLEGQILRTPRR